MKNRALFALFLTFFSMLTQLTQAGNRIFIVKDSLKYCVREYDHGTNVSVMAVADSVRLPVTEDGTLVIPASLTIEGHTYKVEDIEQRGFHYHPEIKHLMLNEGIRFIGERAFESCINLESIHFPTTLMGLDASAFVNCSMLASIIVDNGNEMFDSRDSCNALIKTEDNELVLGCWHTHIPKGVVTIGQCAFSGQRRMSGINIPEGVREIGNGAFSDCSGLKHAYLPLSIKGIGNGTFAGCTSLEELTVPANVQEIGERITLGCHNLKRLTVSPDNKTFDSRDSCNAIVRTQENCIVAGCGSTVIPNSVEKIGEGAFSGSALTRIFIPAGVTQIAETAFNNCNFCSSIEVAQTNPVYDSRSGCNAIIETATGTLVKGCGMTVFPVGVGKIGDYAFCGMTMPANYCIPEGVSSIGSHAFTGCNFRSLLLPESLREIGSSAFTFCRHLENVEMKSSNISIGSMAFNYCYSLLSVRLPHHTTYANSLTFQYSPYQEIHDREYGKP